MKSNLFLYSLVLVASSVCADDMYFHNTSANVSGNNKNFSDSTAWVYADGTTLYNRAPTATDNVFLDNSTNDDKTEYIYLPGAGRDCVASNAKMNNLTVQNNYAANIAQGTNAVLTINGNFTKLRGTNANAAANNFRFTYSGQGNGHDQASSVVVKGDVIVGELDTSGKATIAAGTVYFGGGGALNTLWAASLKSVKIGGNLIQRYNTGVAFNTGYDYDGTSYSSAGEYAKFLLQSGTAPTVEISGAAKPQGGNAGSGYVNPTLYLTSRTSNNVVGSVSIVAINGINGTYGQLSNDVNANATTKSFSILKLTNDASSNYVSNSWGFDWYTRTTPAANNMVSTMIYMAGVGSQKFTGERFCITGGVRVDSGNLQINMSNSVENLTYSRGDLTINGGKFGSMLSSEKNQGQGNMMFSDLAYSDGILMTYVKNGSADKLTLSGTLIRGDNFLDGTKVKYEISGDTESLINTYLQILAWDNTTKFTDFAENDFYADSITVGEKIYNADFKIRDDGLWVGYTAVPEPAQLAAIFALSALAFAAYRRRK